MSCPRSIFVPTVPCSGTWFLLGLLYEHPEVTHFAMLREFRQIGGQAFVDDGGWVTQTWSNEPEKKIPSRPHPQGLNIIHRHMMLREGDHSYTDEGFGLAALLPTVTTVRDPLRCLVTRQEKNPAWQHDTVAHQWTAHVELIQKLDGFNPPAVLPLDLLRVADWSTRHAALAAALSHLGLEPEPHASNVADEWRTDANTRGQYRLKEMFTARDVAGLQRELGIGWEALQRAEPFLRPYLEELGYRNLMWWS